MGLNGPIDGAAISSSSTSIGNNVEAGSGSNYYSSKKKKKKNFGQVSHKLPSYFIDATRCSSIS